MQEHGRAEVPRPRKIISKDSFRFVRQAVVSFHFDIVWFHMELWHNARYLPARRQVRNGFAALMGISRHTRYANYFARMVLFRTPIRGKYAEADCRRCG
jgi:hypothetical protein